MTFRIPVDFSGTAYSLKEMLTCVLPNVMQWPRLMKNISDPLTEWLHTHHQFEQVYGDIYKNDHYFLRRHTTTDIVREDAAGDYFGKARQTGRMFRLIRRVRMHGNPESQAQILEALIVSDVPEEKRGDSH